MSDVTHYVSPAADAAGGPPAVKTTLAAAAVLALLASAFLSSTREKMPDFEVYWRAGQRVAAAQPLYRDEDGHFRHKYWPVFGLLMAPLAALPLPVAKTVWFYLSIAAVVGLLALALRLLPRKKAPPWILVAASFFAMLKFYAHEIDLGQCNTMMALAVLAGVGLLMKDRPAAAGAAFAFSTAIKPYSLLFLPYLLLKRQFTAFGVFLAFVLVGLALPAAIYGVGGNAGQLAAWSQTVAQSTLPNLLNQDNVSIWAMYAKWIGAGPIALALAVATAAAIGTALVAIVRKGDAVTGAEYLDSAMLLVLIPLLSPQGWDYALLMATPAVMLFVNEFHDLPSGVRTAGAAAIVVMACAVFDLLGRTAYAAFMSVSAITVCALALLASIASVRLRRLA